MMGKERQMAGKGQRDRRSQMPLHGKALHGELWGELGPGKVVTCCGGV